MHGVILDAKLKHWAGTISKYNKILIENLRTEKEWSAVFLVHPVERMFMLKARHREIR